MKSGSRQKKNVSKFISRTRSRTRKKRETARSALARAVAETGIPYDAAKFRDRYDGGPYRRKGRARSDERRAVGVLRLSAGGFGFVKPEDETDDGRDLFIPAGGVGAAMTGDTVEIAYRVFRDYEGQAHTEGRVLRVLRYGRETVIGTLLCEGGKYRGAKRDRFYVVPDDPALRLRPYVRGTFAAEEGDKVEVRLLRERGSARYMESEFVRRFGPAFSREANYGAILAACKIPTDFTPEQIGEAERAAQTPITEQGRVLRRERILTIDGADAKDLDDAVSLRRRKDGGWCLGVHIADVSYYVGENSALEELAMQRGNSVYFTDKVVPMLPPALSNGACSLNAGEKKYTLSAMIALSREGEIEGVSIEPSIIVSRVRGVYDEVNAIFGKTASEEVLRKYKDLLPTLASMRALYEVLRKRSAARGALELEESDARILLGADGIPKEILRRERGDAERMIEQFMLAANEAVATLLTEKGCPCVYRVHEPPPEDKAEEFLLYAQNLGLNVAGIDREHLTTLDFSRLLGQAEARGVAYPLSRRMLCSMAKAVYSEGKKPHFGLSINCYCHFTSPIRRLSDLATHRVIRRVLLEGRAPQSYAPYIRRAASAATEGELRAMTAERRIDALYKALYLSERIGETFPAVITSVTNFGIFAELANTCEGLIPIEDLPQGAIFDAPTYTLRTSTRLYRTADAVTVRVEEADIIRGKVRFSLVADRERQDAEAEKPSRAGQGEKTPRKPVSPDKKREKAAPPSGKQGIKKPHKKENSQKNNI